ncbi:LysR family transcriptional regulator [Mesorhizobium sp. M00.F.Ca.ET.151.01.1.1]|uniref:LysR family transcriptional regulator n=1 Tax=Mesorhizobium sp. TaxID=1871066 RepID=UPI000FE87147|nr:LysR family transcriptional regulator [Mesorhizobium sp.]RWC88756.1 MAG: LysR family transcriptional regulator [Mesorhizobium sp.]TGU96682.1 LysR family transcriptional regulator [Mesorhizobium sp. M00.F.Ca.ET.151.01.1.1]
METRDLQTFLAVAACGSITKAADMLGRSQPAVTRTIQDLEAELGFELLHRIGRRVQLSEEGVAFEEEARRLLMSFTELAARAKMIAAGKGRILQVATTAAIGNGLIPTALAELKDIELPYETHIGHFLSSTVAQEVRSGRAEMGFSSLPLDTPGLDVLRLYSAPVVVAMHEGDALAEFDVVPLSAFSGRRLATILNPLRFQSHITRTLAARGIETGPVIRTNTAYSALLIAIKTGVAAIIDPLTAYGLSPPGVIIRAIDITVPFYWGVLVAQNRPLRAVPQALVEAVEAVAERSIAGFTRLDPGMAGQLVTGPGSSINYGTGI